ncbi:Organic cation transporter-like protein [Halotydeus destructor]|nr:Organic cation transporter-like protein [Halotydeus destructor]
MAIDKEMNQLGDFGRYQCYVYLISAIPAFLVGAAAIQNVFLLGVPKHRCFIDGLDSVNSDFDEPWVSHTIPGSSSCLMYNLTDQLGQGQLKNLTSISCSRYVYSNTEFEETAASEWDLVCDKKWLISLSASKYMFGHLVGSVIYGIMADKYGRRSVFAIGGLLQVMAAILVSFSSNIYVFTLANFLVSTNSMGLFVVSFVLGIEFIGPKYRVLCANSYRIFFAVGSLTTAALAYFIRHWRHLELTLSVLYSLTILLEMSPPESPRWLDVKGRHEEALDVLRRAAKRNGLTMGDSNTHKVSLGTAEKAAMLEDDNNNAGSKERDMQLSVIYKHAKLRRWSLNLYYTWAVNALIYFGLSFSVGSSEVKMSVYVMSATMSVVEIPFILIMTLAMTRYGRKLPLIVSYIATGLCCSLAAIFAGKLGFLFSVLGKGTIASSFAMIFLYTAEVYPTMVRSAAFGLCSTMGRVGAIAAPGVLTLDFLGSTTPLIVCAVAALVAAILALDLPETHGKPLPESLADVDLLGEDTLI